MFWGLSPTNDININVSIDLTRPISTRRPYGWTCRLSLVFSGEIDEENDACISEWSWSEHFNFSSDPSVRTETGGASESSSQRSWPSCNLCLCKIAYHSHAVLLWENYADIWSNFTLCRMISFSKWVVSQNVAISTHRSGYGFERCFVISSFVLCGVWRRVSMIFRVGKGRKICITCADGKATLSRRATLHLAHTVLMICKLYQRSERTVKGECERTPHTKKSPRMNESGISLDDLSSEQALNWLDMPRIW